MFWLELAAYSLGGLMLAYGITGAMSRPGAIAFFERHVVGPLSGLLVLAFISAILSNPHLQTIAGLAAFLHNEAGY